MQNEKMFINLAPGQNEIILREGAAPKVLDPKAPVKINIEGIITAPCEFLNKRINAGQFEQKDCHIIVNREEIKISLVVNESDEYKRGVDVANNTERFQFLNSDGQDCIDAEHISFGSNK